MMDSVKEKTKEAKKVSLGVGVEMVVNDHSQTWQIVRVEESDISCGKISNDAPLVRLVWGRRAGEVVEGKIGNRFVTVEIKAIS